MNQGASREAEATKRLFAAAHDASAAGFARSADRLVYAYLARPLAGALAGAGGPVLDVASGSGALGRLLPAAVALDLSAAQLRHNPLGRRVLADAERPPFRDGAFAGVGCAFGINHFPDPAAAVAEMARVAPLVGLLTWVRPEEPYAPKLAVLEVVERRAGSDRTVAGAVADELGERVGSPAAVRALLAGAGLRPEVGGVEVDLPWPGAAAFVDYRLATVGGVHGLVDAAVDLGVALLVAVDVDPADRHAAGDRRLPDRGHHRLVAPRHRPGPAHVHRRHPPDRPCPPPCPRCPLPAGATPAGRRRLPLSAPAPTMGARAREEGWTWRPGTR